MTKYLWQRMTKNDKNCSTYKGIPPLAQPKMVNFSHCLPGPVNKLPITFALLIANLNSHLHSVGLHLTKSFCWLGKVPPEAQAQAMGAILLPQSCSKALKGGGTAGKSSSWAKITPKNKAKIQSFNIFFPMNWIAFHETNGQFWCEHGLLLYFFLEQKQNWFSLCFFLVLRRVNHSVENE